MTTIPQTTDAPARVPLTDLTAIPRQLVRIAALVDQRPAECALVMLHCARDDQAAVDWYATQLDLPAAQVAPDHSRYSTSGEIGHTTVHVLCRITEDPHAKRERLAAELAKLDTQIAQAAP